MKIMKKSLPDKEHRLCSGPDREKPIVTRTRRSRRKDYKKKIERQQRPDWRLLKSCIYKDLAHSIIQKALKRGGLAHSSVHPSVHPCIQPSLHLSAHKHLSHTMLFLNHEYSEISSQSLTSKNYWPDRKQFILYLIQTQDPSFCHFVVLISDAERAGSFTLLSLSAFLQLHSNDSVVSDNNQASYLQITWQINPVTAVSNQTNVPLSLYENTCLWIQIQTDTGGDNKQMYYLLCLSVQIHKQINSIGRKAGLGYQHLIPEKADCQSLQRRNVFTCNKGHVRLI